MGFLSSLVAYLTVVAAFSGMMLATFFYLTSPSDPARAAAEAKRSAEAKPAAVQQASPERGRTAGSRKTIAAEAKAPAPATSKPARPAIASTGEASASAPTNASIAPADRTTGSGPSASERKLSQSEPNAETPAPSKPPKKVKKRAKRQPAVARRAPPPRPSFDQWNGRFAGPPERSYSYERYSYERSPFQYDRGASPYERGPFWYR